MEVDLESGTLYLQWKDRAEMSAGKGNRMVTGRNGGVQKYLGVKSPSLLTGCIGDSA